MLQYPTYDCGTLQTLIASSDREGLSLLISLLREEMHLYDAVALSNLFKLINWRLMELKAARLQIIQ